MGRRARGSGKGVSPKNDHKDASQPTREDVPQADVAELAIDIWRIENRVKGMSGNDRLLVACERAEARLSRMGFRWEDPAGRAYDTGMNMKVIEHIEGPEPPTVLECLKPAIYHRDDLLLPAEIVIQGMLDAK